MYDYNEVWRVQYMRHDCNEVSSVRLQRGAESMTAMKCGVHGCSEV